MKAKIRKFTIFRLLQLTLSWNISVLEVLEISSHRIVIRLLELVTNFQIYLDMTWTISF